MAKKRYASSAQDKRQKKNAKHIADSKIDFSDIPELSSRELRQARSVGRPRSAHVKQLVAIRLDPRLLIKLRKIAEKQEKPYQTLIHEILEEACKKAA